VQNIGAYGTELDEVFAYADVFDLATGDTHRVGRDDARHAYRDSLFKHARNLVVLRVALRLGSRSVPNLSYKDLAAAERSGTPLKTPLEVATAIRGIRSLKFPDLREVGTAGSFFKNPVLPRAEAEALAKKYHGLPLFPQADEGVKLPLAWLLDHVLGLKGYTNGRARLFEKQPLVIVAERGASALEVESLAREVEMRVANELSIILTREVETFLPRTI
jgi:UDP-N-acetylmuramate dehydrogenase